VIVEPGETVRVAGLAGAVWTSPSDQVSIHGPLPVNATESVVG